MTTLINDSKITCFEKKNWKENCAIGFEFMPNNDGVILFAYNIKKDYTGRPENTRLYCPAENLCDIYNAFANNTSIVITDKEHNGFRLMVTCGNTVTLENTQVSSERIHIEDQTFVTTTKMLLQQYIIRVVLG